MEYNGSGLATTGNTKKFWGNLYQSPTFYKNILAAMYHYLTLIFQICLLRKNPSDIPYSKSLLKLSIIVSALISIPALLLSFTPLEAALQLTTEFILSLAFIITLLMPTQKMHRFIQVGCAFFGTSALISLFAFPVLATLSLQSSHGLALLTMLGLMIWHIIINTHIIRHALDERFSFSLGIALLYIFCSYQIMGVLFPSINEIQ